MIIDGENAILGRLASYAAKEALKGEEIIVVNCDNVLVTGNRKTIEREFLQKRKKVGSGQKGPKYSKSNERIIKRTIRGMLPDFRKGRGKEALKRIKCYNGIPEDYKNSKKIKLNFENKMKAIKVKEIFNE